MVNVHNKSLYDKRFAIVSDFWTDMAVFHTMETEQLDDAEKGIIDAFFVCPTLYWIQFAHIGPAVAQNCKAIAIRTMIDENPYF